MALHLSGVSKAFRSRSGVNGVLQDISLDIADGESVALVGESGIGKSTLVNLIAGYILPDAGEVICDGRIVVGPGPERLMVTQNDALFPWLTVDQNARYAALVGHYRTQRNEIKERADALLKRFGLWQHRHKFPNALSGGQRRRVELVRAFAVVPRVLLMDEPYSSLDEGLRTELSQYLLEWRRESREVCTILVTHDFDEAVYLADRVFILGGQPASIIAEVRVDFGMNRDAELRLREDYQNIVRWVRRQYYDARAAQSVVEI